VYPEEVRLVSFLFLAALGCHTPSPSAHDADSGPEPAFEPPQLTGAFFEDVTTASGIDFERVPTEDWTSFADRQSGGICIVNADGVGAPDLFFALRPSASGGSRLYVADTALAYRDETEARGLAGVGDAMGCLAFDADSDGREDLLVTTTGGAELWLWRDGAYVDASAVLEVTFVDDGIYTSAAAGDVDGDGDVDLVIAGYLVRDPAIEARMDCDPMPCAVDVNLYEPIASHLLVAEPGPRFVDRTETLAPDLATPEPTLVVAIGDFAGTGESMIFKGNDLGWLHPNRLLRPVDDGTFRDDAETLGFAYNYRGRGGNSMGLSSGDIDRDGLLEHAVTDSEGASSAIFHCLSPGSCADRGRVGGMAATQSTFRWAPAFVDLDADGFIDLVEATGHVFDDEEIAVFDAASPRDQPLNILMNRGDARLILAEPDDDDGSVAPRSVRGLAITDLDGDGAVDLVLAPSLGRPALLRNVTARRGRSLAIELVGAPPNPSAVGARVEVHVGDVRLVRERRAGEGLLGSFDPRLFFGVGDADEVDVSVRWPSGAMTSMNGVSPDRTVRLYE